MKFAKIDRNQPEVVKAMRATGATVQHLHAVGSGCPDLLCAVNGINFLVEVKDGEKAPSAQKLTPDQVVWHAAWKAPVYVINSVPAAIELVQKIKANHEHDCAE